MILFCENEEFFNESYIETLTAKGLSVHLERSVSGCIEFFHKHINEIDLIVMDIMFSLPDGVPAGIDESKIMGGRRAGVEILRIMNETPHGRSIPKVILTNVAAQDFHDYYSQSDEVKKCLRKMETLPSDFVKIVLELLQKKGD